MFWKVLFLWWSIPSFSFIGYTPMEVIKKSDNWRQICKQTSSNFYTSNDVSRRKNCSYVITRLRNTSLITFFKKILKQSLDVKTQSPEGFCKKGDLRNFANFTEKHLCWSLFIKVASLQPTIFLKRDSNSSAFLWSFQNLRVLILKNSCKLLLSGGVL